MRRTWVGNEIVDHSDVVGAAPVSAAPTTSSFSTEHLASIYCAKITASRVQKHLNFGIWCDFYWRFYGTSYARVIRKVEHRLNFDHRKAVGFPFGLSMQHWIQQCKYQKGAQTKILTTDSSNLALGLAMACLSWLCGTIFSMKPHCISLCQQCTVKHECMTTNTSLHWRHNGHNGISNQQPHDCLLNRLKIVYSTVYSGEDQRKHQSSVSLAFVRGIQQWPVNSLHKGPVTQKMFPFDDVIMIPNKVICQQPDQGLIQELHENLEWNLYHSRAKLLQDGIEATVTAVWSHHDTVYCLNDNLKRWCLNIDWNLEAISKGVIT